jgi:hypothetical protein
MQVRCRTVPSAAACDQAAAADNQARGVGSPPGLGAVLEPGFQILGGDGDGGERGRPGKHVPHFAYPALALFRPLLQVLLVYCISCAALRRRCFLYAATLLHHNAFVMH